MSLLKPLERVGKSVLTFILKMIVKQESITGNNITPEDIKRVLIVRQDRRVGNLILTTPLIESTSKIFKNAEVDIIVAKGLKVLCEDIPFVNDIYPFDHKTYIKNPYTFFRFISSLRRKKYQLAIESSNPRGSSFLNGFITYLTKAEYRIGFGTGNGSIFTNVHITPGKLKHYYELQQELINFTSAEKIIFKPKIANDPSTIAINKDKLIKHYGIQKDSKLIGIWIGARGKKKWDLANFKKLYKRISSETNHFPVLVFGIEEKKQYKEFFNSKYNIIKLDELERLKLFISSCDIFICGDTGPLHLSFALGVSTIGVFLENNYIRYGYANEVNNFIIKPDKPEIMITEIIRSIDIVLSNNHHL